MIIKRKQDILGTRGDARGDRWHSYRLLHEGDGMQVVLTDSILEAGFEMQLWQKNHLRAFYCLEGKGTLEEVDSGVLNDITPGTVFAMDSHDRQRIKAKTRMRIICTFYPGLTDHKVRYAGGLLKMKLAREGRLGYSQKPARLVCR